MRRVLALALLVAAGCDRPPEATAIQRGERTFRPMADRLGSTIAGDLKKADAAGFEHYLKEIGGKDESDLVRKISTEVLAHYAEALSISSSKEADLNAGTFDDAMNLRKIQSAVAGFTKAKARVPPVCQALVQKYGAGEWKSGLELEFSARILEAQALQPRN